MPTNTTKMSSFIFFATAAVLAFAPMAAFADEPIADFRWYTDDLTVVFQDLSSGQVDTWLWDLGNGDFRSGATLEYTYAEGGTYYVTLTVENDFGQSHRTYPVTVAVGSGNAPGADFTWATDLLSAVFVDLSVGQIQSWQWTFGDGNSSTERNPTYFYAAAGTYEVKLRVTNEWGYSERIRNVTVTNEPGTAPEARFRWGAVGTTVRFEDRSYGDIDERIWDFGDGNGSTAAFPTYTFSSPGYYEVTLTVSNDFGQDSLTQTIEVDEISGEAPIADFRYVANGLTVYFDNLSSGQVDTQAWSFGDGTFSTETDPVKTYDEPGVYDVELRVTNGFGSSSRTATIEVGAEIGDAPFANYRWAADGLDVAFEDLSTGEVESWAWSFGDGTTSTDQNPTHSFAADGSYEVTLVVANGFGSSSRTSYVIVGERDDITGFVRFVAGTAFAPGAEGSFWRTTLDINNRGTELMTYELWWLPRGQNNSEPVKSTRFTLGAGRSRLYDNVLSEVFGLEAATRPFGTVVIASNSSEFISVSRTFSSDEDGTGGSVGQSLPGVDYGEMIVRGDKQRLVFMSENVQYRANVGCQSGTERGIQINFEMFDQDGSSLGITDLYLPPLSNQQINRILESFAPVHGYIDIWSDTPDSRFFCYGSVLDNITSDPTTILTK